MNDYSMDENEMYGGSNGSSRNGDSLLVVGDVMNVEAQKERRNSIREIMSDDTLTPLEKRRSIQSLMDGRRRSSVTRSSSSSQGEMARAAAEAAEYYQSDTEGDSASVAMDSSSNGDYYIDPDDPRRQPLPPPPPPYHSEYSSGSDIELESRYNTITNNNDERLVQSPIDTIAHNSHHQNSGRKQRSSSMPLWSEDTSRAAAPLVAASSNAIWDDPINISRRMEKSRPPCSHYERNCTIVSPCCGLAFGCRICHDECPVLPMPFARRPPVSAPPNIGVDNVNIAAENATSSNPVMTGGDTTRVLNWDAVDGKKHKQEKRRSLPLSYEEQETHHEINRFAIAEIICRLCYTRQSSKTNFCITCGSQFGAYHCNICNLWMSDEESPYHCADCGFCRVGGRDNFRHCHDCGMCIDALLFDDHNCKAGKYMSNCPVCQEDLFSSRDASHEMPCGHAIHWHCFKELTSYDTRCPVCKKTAETPEHMAPTWHAMAMGIALQPVPPELARMVTIQCNDCEERDEDRRWHFLGVRCRYCTSFNTTVEGTTLTGREAALYLDELDKARGTSDADVLVDAGSQGDDLGYHPMDANY